MQHLDEGTIHAWLDGALPPAEALAVERHAAECAQCGALVAEARGLVAASSRILATLDAAARPSSPVGAASPTAPETFVARRARPPVRSWLTRNLRYNAVVAAAIAFLAIGVFGVSRVAREQDDVFVAASESMADSALAVPPAREAVPTVASAPTTGGEIAARTTAGALPGAAEQRAKAPIAPAPAPSALGTRRGVAGGARADAPEVAVAERAAERADEPARAQTLAGAAAGAAPRDTTSEFLARAPGPPAAPAADTAAVAQVDTTADATPALPSVLGARPARAAGVQPVSVEGKVTDQEGVPLRGAAVTVAGRAGARAATDSAGRYTLRDLTPGVYEVRVRRSGYETASDTVRAFGDVSGADVRLRRRGAPRAESAVAARAPALDTAAAVSGAKAGNPAVAIQTRRQAPAELVGCYALAASGPWLPNEPGGVALPLRLTLAATAAGTLQGVPAWGARDAGNPAAAGGRWTRSGRDVTVELPTSGGPVVLTLRPADGALRGTASTTRRGVTATRDVTARRGCD